MSLAYGYLSIVIIQPVPLCVLSFIKVISCTGAVCQPMEEPLYLLGVKYCMSIHLASLGEGLCRSDSAWTARAVPALPRQGLKDFASFAH